MELISKRESMSFTNLPRGDRDVMRYIPHTFALTLRSDAGKLELTSAHHPIRTSGRVGKREHVISALELISRRESMSFTNMPRGDRDVMRYRLHKFAVTFGSDAGK